MSSVVADARADRYAAQTEFLHCVLDLLRGEVGKLEADRSKRDEAVGIARANLYQPFVIETHDFRGSIAIGPIPERIDAERFHVDALHVHVAQPGRRVLHHDAAGMVVVGVLTEKLRRCRNQAVRVHVDGFHAAALDHDFAALDGGLRRARASLRRRSKPRLLRGHQLAARENDCGIRGTRMGCASCDMRIHCMLLRWLAELVWSKFKPPENLTVPIPKLRCKP
jgi:hypothetical protein